MMRPWVCYVLVRCPRCDYQGVIYRVRFRADNITGYLCDECDALWFDKDNIGDMTKFNDLTTYMKNNGLLYSLDEFSSREKEWA